MVDFSKLRALTADEIIEADQRRRDQTIAADITRRRERCRKAVTITLSQDAERRFSLSGTHGKQSNGWPVRATWFAPDYLTDEQFNKFANELTEGTELVLNGYWKPLTNSSGATSFTFIAQFIRFTDGPRVP